MNTIERIEARQNFGGKYAGIWYAVTCDELSDLIKMLRSARDACDGVVAGDQRSVFLLRSLESKLSKLEN